MSQPGSVCQAHKFRLRNLITSLRLVHKYLIMYMNVYGYQYCIRMVLNYKTTCLHHMNILVVLTNIVLFFV